MAFLELSGITKSFGATQVVKTVDLGIEQGEFVTLLGPSGCGKTTILRMVAGFETPSSGSISINGRDVVALRPNQRNIGMVFQAYALFPNMTVSQNVGFGLKVAGTSAAEAAPRVAEMLNLVGLGEFGARYPFQLSGGQQQRVALARALANQPQLLLLDEPLSALDAKIRVSLREEIRRIQKELGITTVFVTHDQEEALSMSDRIVVMNAGRVEQLGTPFDIYNRPETPFVAGFVGQLSRIPAKVIDPSTGTVDVEGQPLALGRKLSAKPGEQISLDLRPEMIEPGAIAGRQTVTGTVEEVAFLGSVVRIRLRTGGAQISLDTFNKPGSPPPKVGETYKVSFDPSNLLI